MAGKEGRYEITVERDNADAAERDALRGIESQLRRAGLQWAEAPRVKVEQRANGFWRATVSGYAERAIG